MHWKYEKCIFLKNMDLLGTYKVLLMFHRNFHIFLQTLFRVGEGSFDPAPVLDSLVFWNSRRGSKTTKKEVGKRHVFLTSISLINWSSWVHRFERIVLYSIRSAVRQSSLISMFRNGVLCRCVENSNVRACLWLVVSSLLTFCLLMFSLSLLGKLVSSVSFVSAFFLKKECIIYFSRCDFGIKISAFL